MPTLNFNERFAHLVVIGAKRQTIRRKRKYPIKTGDRLVFYSGLRQKGKAQKLGEAICLSIHPVMIDRNRLVLDGAEEDSRWQEKLALCDGLSSWQELTAWLDSMYGLPFEGVVICW